MSAAAAFTVTGLTRNSAPRSAVDAVDLSAPAGQFTCLVGPSGCGKTTLLRLLMGLEQPSAGTIALGGVDVTHVAPAKRGMGMVFQSYALFPNMRVGANIAFAMPRALSAQDKARRTAALLETVGLPGLERRYPGQLSGGQQQRVAIARALAVEPRILLLDEPLAALDPQIREQLRLELKALQRRLGVTTVMVTHDQAEALAVADLIVVMRAGRIEQMGSPQAVYDAPANPFVASFLGAANLLEAAGGGSRHGAPAWRPDTGRRYRCFRHGPGRCPDGAPRSGARGRCRSAWPFRPGRQSSVRRCAFAPGSPPGRDRGADIGCGCRRGQLDARIRRGYPA